MKPSDYLHLQMELEGIRSSGGNLIARASPYSDDLPLVLFASTVDDQKYLYFDDALSADIRDRLLTTDIPSFNIKNALDIVRMLGMSVNLGEFRTYIFPADLHTDIRNVKCFRQHDPAVAAFGFSGLADTVYAIEQEGVIVSACVSSRQNGRSAEAWVATHPNHRRKGYAQQVVSAWAGSMQRQGIIPFYSHSLQNTNSGNLARTLGLIHVFDEAVIEQAG
ncbi:MAG: GNAT family N-acetyltransferase [Anaerolineales bacterium]